MKQYKKMRGYDDVCELMKEKGMEIDPKNFNMGNDFICFKGKWYEKPLSILLNVSTGKFFIYHSSTGETLASYKSTDLDDEEWYCAIMDILYEPLEAETELMQPALLQQEEMDIVAAETTGGEMAEDIMDNMVKNMEENMGEDMVDDTVDNMAHIPTFIDGKFDGLDTLKEIDILRAEAYETACRQQEATQADHMIYCHYDLDDGNIRAAWLYSGLAMTDEEFNRIAKLKNAFIGAIDRQR